MLDATPPPTPPDNGCPLAIEKWLSDLAVEKAEREASDPSLRCCRCGEQIWHAGTPRDDYAIGRICADCGDHFDGKAR